MGAGPARVLYLPNERGGALQGGMRKALSQLQQAGLVAEARVFSYLRRADEDGREQMLSELGRAVRQGSPSIVLVQHPSGSGITASDWQALRRQTDFTMVYHEGDAYGSVRKRMRPEMRAAARAADVVYTTGASHQRSLMRRAGARDVRWCPSVYSPQDFGVQPLTADKEFDVVMIANHSPSKVPLLSMPGTRERARLQHLLAEALGNRFALYGTGWSGPHARGRVPYLEQEAIIRRAAITVNWDHFPREELFFSDRLPIALASGTLHVTTRHPGYERFFGESLSFLRFAMSPEDVLAIVTRLLEDLGPGDLLERAAASRAYACQHLRQDDQLVALLNSAGAGIDPASARAIWSVPGPGLTEL